MRALLLEDGAAQRLTQYLLDRAGEGAFWADSGGRFFYVVLTAFVMISAIMVSYTRARAESLIGSCRVGFMERPERLVLVILGALFNRMAPVLWVIAVLSTITVIHRMRYTWTRTQDPPVALTPNQAA